MEFEKDEAIEQDECGESNDTKLGPTGSRTQDGKKILSCKFLSRDSLVVTYHFYIGNTSTVSSTPQGVQNATGVMYMPVLAFQKMSPPEDLNCMNRSPALRRPLEYYTVPSGQIRGDYCHVYVFFRTTVTKKCLLAVKPARSTMGWGGKQ